MVLMAVVDDPLPLPTYLSPQGAHGEGTTSRGAVAKPYALPSLLSVTQAKIYARGDSQAPVPL